MILRREIESSAHGTFQQCSHGFSKASSIWSETSELKHVSMQIPAFKKVYVLLAEHQRQLEVWSRAEASPPQCCVFF
jgi:hypothetical protein